MFLFSQDQEVFEIDGTKIGGQPGEYPTVLIGSIFYDGHEIVNDSQKGIFDEEAARKQIKRLEDLSQKTGNPAMLDVVGENSDALKKFIDFIGEASDLPFLIDGTTSEVRSEAALHVGDIGLADRAVYNAITTECKSEEIEALKEASIESAILLCFNSKKPTVDGRLESLERILEFASEANIENTLIDPSILDLPDPGPAARTIYRIKEEYGLPAGCGAHNAVDQWRDRLDEKMDSIIYTLRSAVANSFPLVLGADFALYGPIDDSEEMFTACSLSDAYVAYAMRMEEGKGPDSKDHPLYKIFRT